MLNRPVQRGYLKARQSREPLACIELVKGFERLVAVLSSSAAEPLLHVLRANLAALQCFPLREIGKRQRLNADDYWQHSLTV